MAWTTPLTAVTGAPFTAGHYNTYIRDNLLETAVAKADEGGKHFVADGQFSVAARKATRDYVSSTATIDSTDYVAGSPSGPTVTVTTGTKAIIMFGCEMDNTSVDFAMRMTYEISGATTLAAAEVREINRDGHDDDCPCKWGAMHIRDDLTPGVNIFTAKYRGSGGSVLRRELVVVPF